jgi:hypothetical protein
MKRTKNIESESLSDNLIFEIFNSDGGYISVNKKAIKILGLLPAIILGNYINKAEYFKEKYPDCQGWFYLSHKRQMEELNLGESVIRKYKQLLISKGILRVKMQGLPAKEWITINKIALGIEVRKSEVLWYENNTPYSINTIYRNNKEIESTVPTFSNTSKENNKEYIPLAQMLADIIISKKNIKITPAKINSWANDIRKMDITDGISFKRIKRVLFWYAGNIGGKYIPVIESGSSLREKFIRLENAMENDGYKKQDKMESTYVEPDELADKFKKTRS